MGQNFHGFCKKQYTLMSCTETSISNLVNFSYVKNPLELTTS